MIDIITRLHNTSYQTCNYYQTVLKMDQCQMVDNKAVTGNSTTSGFDMGPNYTYRCPCLSSPDKKTFPLSNNYPKADEGVLRIWGLRYYDNGVIGWEVGMEPA